MKDGLEDLLTFKFSMGEVEDKIDEGMHKAKESKEDKFLMKDFDPFFSLKRSSNFLLSKFFLQIEPLFLESIIFFLRCLSFFNLDSSEVKIADEGNSHESRRNLKSDVNLETWFEDNEEGCISKDAEGLFLSGGKTSWVGGAFEGLLLGLKTDSDFALEVKVDAIKVEATIASWVFFFF